MPQKLPAKFISEEAAREYLESIQWPDGPICPHCGTIDRASRIAGGRKGLLFCNSCREQFTVTVGTVFERSKVPLHTWLYANHLLCCSKKGISSHQLARMLGVTYKTAWFMAHRLRMAMEPGTGVAPMGGKGVIVESDETELAPSKKTKRRPGRTRADNKNFVSLVERGGRVRSRVITGAHKNIGVEIREALMKNMHPESTLHTDGATHYIPVPFAHESVDHDKAYARTAEDGSRVHSNSAEGYFSIFKRGLVGTYQHMSEQHLHRYLAEFDFRMSNRERLGVNDAMRADLALKGVSGKRLMYRRPDRQEEPQVPGGPEAA
jgi:transposase-like protein